RRWGGGRASLAKTSSRTPSRGTATTNGGGGRSRTRIPSSASTTRASTAAADLVPGVPLITGATGFAGGHLLDRLAARGPVHAWAHRGQSRRSTDGAKADSRSRVGSFAADPLARALVH